MRKQVGWPIFVFLLCCPGAPGAIAGETVPWEQLRKTGEEALSNNNYGVAERSFLPALQEAERFGSKDIRVAISARNLGLLYSARGQFAKAEPYLERELRVKEKVLGGEHPEVVNLVGKMAQFYLSHGNPAKADKLTALLVNFASKKLAEQTKLDGQMQQVSRYLSTHPGFEEPARIAKQLDDSTRKSRATYFLELGATLDALGGLYKGQNKLQNGEQMYKAALALRESSLPPGHLALALSYENLGNLYVLQGRNELAEPLFKKSLEVTEQTVQPGKPEVFRRVDSLAKSYLSLGQTAEAESLYRRTQDLLEKTKANSVDTGNNALALATLYVKEGKFAQAEPLMKRAMLVTESNNGPQHAALVPIMDAYADVLEKLNKGNDASKLRARARSIREGSLVQSREADSF